MKKANEVRTLVDVQPLLRKVAKARSIRNPVVGKSRERFYLIDAATMRLIKQLAKQLAK